MSDKTWGRALRGGGGGVLKEEGGENMGGKKKDYQGISLLANIINTLAFLYGVMPIMERPLELGL